MQHARILLHVHTIRHEAFKLIEVEVIFVVKPFQRSDFPVAVLLVFVDYLHLEGDGNTQYDNEQLHQVDGP